MSQRQGDDGAETTAASGGAAGAKGEESSTLTTDSQRVQVEDRDYLSLTVVDPAHYVMGQEVARGGMGRIVVARDRRLGRGVAVKEILSDQGNARVRFEREARITARLQHPSIVNVHEAGVWPGGDAFYAMSLVAGRSLDVVIAEARTLEERLALVPNVLAVADAMAYAHGQRIIHRDLKPGNVLVGNFGETVVIDWGLAKDLLGASGEVTQPAEPAPAGPSGEVVTAVGSVMGTPAYMPVEQSEGRSVDERADVYALGAILHHVLAGAAPYQGRGAMDVLAQVRAGPPVPLAERQPGVPTDLSAIVTRAMARDPAQRYPTARELAEDLRRFQTGQLVGAHRYTLGQLLGRWVRRNRAAVAVGAAAVLALLVVGGVALRSVVAAERVAQGNKREAEELLGYLLNDLRDKLTPLGRLDLMLDSARKVAAYYERRSGTVDSVEASARAEAKAYLGSVLGQQGKLADGLVELEAAVAQLEELVRAYPQEPGHRQALIRAQLAIARTCLGADRPQQAIVAIEGAQQAWATLPREVVTTYESRLMAAEFEGFLGSAHWALGDTRRATPALEHAIERSEALALEFPEKVEALQVALARRIGLANLFIERGDDLRAILQLEAALLVGARAERLAPADSQLQRLLASAHDALGVTLLKQGRSQRSLVELRTSLDLNAALSARDPTDFRLQEYVLVARVHIADALRDQGLVGEAMATYREALTVVLGLVGDHPEDSRWQEHASSIRDDLGSALIAAGDLDGGVAEYRISLAEDQRLADAAPSNMRLQYNLTLGHAALGEALLTTGQFASAVDELGKAVASLRAVLARDPSNRERAVALIRATHLLGNAHLAARDLSRWGQARTESLRLAREDLSLRPGDRGAAVRVATALFEWSDVQWEGGDLAGARASLEEAVAAYAALAKTAALDSDQLDSLALAQDDLGDVYLSQGARTEAATAFQDCLSTLQKRLGEGGPTDEVRRRVADVTAKLHRVGAVAPR